MTAYASYSDTELIQLLRLGEERAYTEIYNRYWRVLFNVAANKTGSLSEAEELVQDIFLDIWKRRKEIEITSNLRSYLAVALKYRVINLLVKRKRRLTYERQAGKKMSVADASTEQWLGFHDLRERIARVVADLPERCRLVYQLKKESGYTQREIAIHLQISEKAVEAHINKALKVLRTSIRFLLL